MRVKDEEHPKPNVTPLYFYESNASYTHHNRILYNIDLFGICNTIGDKIS